MSLSLILLLNLGLIAGLMFVLWLISLLLRNASIVDVFWGLGVVAVTWASALAAADFGPRGMLISVLTSLWGLRLATYLAWRNLGKGEDYRYRAMRERLGRRFPITSLFTVFGLQGLIMWLVAIPIQAAHLGTAPLGGIDAMGVGLWMVGWSFESIGDLQLARFKLDPENAGKVMDQGLWRYTRHPNYFGDFLVWWGLYFIAATGGAWWAIFSPLLMSILLLRVSGVTLLEDALKKKRAGYVDYVQRTSPFFPWPPKRT